MKRLLIIGNGFDLAHKLPTSYNDFLDFCILWRRLEKYPQIPSSLDLAIEELKKEKSSINIQVQHSIDSIFDINSTVLKSSGFVAIHNAFMKKAIKFKSIKAEFSSLIKENIWIEHFRIVRSKLGEKWIDFENEIFKVLSNLNAIINNSTKDPRFQYLVKRLAKVVPDYEKDQIIDIKKWKWENCVETLRRHLNELTRALEIYLAGVVENIPVEIRIPEIIKEKFDIVLSFNYTNTFRRLYQTGLSDKRICYIHGKAKLNNCCKYCNLVLGVQEFLKNVPSNNKADLLVFQKYYQRIFKRTDTQYLDWTKIAEDEKKHCYDIVIIGHSLDVTDQEILKPFIISDSCKVKIYHHSKKSMGSHIKNLLQFKGTNYREIIKKTGRKNATIKFVGQKKA